MKPVRLWIGLLLSLAACSDGHGPYAEAWQRYSDGLARSLKREAPDQQVHTLGYPQRAALRLSAEAMDISLIDFLRLRRCALAQTLAERNSILGKHRNDATELVFTLRFLDEVQGCITERQVAGDTELAATLLAAQALKQRQLPVLLNNALLAGQEYRQFWTSPPEQRQAYPRQYNDRAIVALQRWHQLQQQWLSASHYHRHDEVMEILDELRAGLGGELLRFQSQTLAGLVAANQLLKRRLETRPLCLQGSPTPQAKRYQAVLRRHFIETLQPLAAQSHRHQHALTTTVRAIEAELAGQLQKTGGLAEPYRNWQAQRDTLLSSSTAAQRQHVSLSRRLLEQCGLAPAS